METSDSEYFESADEDFDSDFESDFKSKQSILHGPSHKIIEPELCKLKLDETEENSISTDQKNSSCTNNNDVSSKNVESNISGLDNKINTVAHLKKHEVERLVNITKEKCDVGIKEEVKKEEPITDEQTLVISKNEIVNSERTILPEVSVSNESTILQQEPENKNVSEITPVEQEDNLWDDDEIDWGSEAAKEESQRTGSSLKSRNEDSGWDDFDADWETDVPVSSSQNIDIHPNKTCNKNNAYKSTLNQPRNSEDYGDWEPLEKPEEKQRSNEESQSGWGSWGGWGVSSILNTATQSVSTLTSHVSQGLSAVLETGMGIPEPEELAKMNAIERQNSDIENSENANVELTQPVSFGLGNLVSGVSHLTKFVESTGTKVIAGSLDTLEAIGKKTVEVLQEGDPGLKKKRAFLKLEGGKPNLSQILREAKEKSEEEKHQQSDLDRYRKIKNYETLFDDHQGLVHLEALEMLSRVCSIKLEHQNNTMTPEAFKEMQDTMDQIKELCELPEDDDEEIKISLAEAKSTIDNAVQEINIPISYNKFFETCEETDNWLNNVNLSFIDDTELHQQAIEALAQLTALSIEQFHKSAELLMVKEHRSTADEADSLVQITTTLKSVILNEANKFTDKLGSFQKAEKEKVNEQITNIFYEAANSGTYIQNAFQLLIPILQVGAV